MKWLMKLILNVILLPVLPIRLGWKWSKGIKASNGKGDEDPILGRLVGTIMISLTLYYLAGVAIKEISKRFLEEETQTSPSGNVVLQEKE